MPEKPPRDYATYFEAFESFDVDASYIPTVIFDALTALDFSDLFTDEPLTSALRRVLDIVLRKAFQPLGITTPPLGYARELSPEVIAERTKLPPKTVSKILLMLESIGIIEVRGDDVHIQEPHEWLPEEQQSLASEEALNVGRRKVYTATELSRILL